MSNVPIDLDANEEPGNPPRAATFDGEQFDRLIDAIKGNQTGRVEAEAQIHALAMRKQLRPDNEVHPDISVYNPLGERDHPRPPLKCPMFLGPYPLEEQTLLLKEITYLNQLEPGTYESPSQTAPACRSTSSRAFAWTGARWRRSRSRSRAPTTIRSRTIRPSCRCCVRWWSCKRFAN